MSGVVWQEGLSSVGGGGDSCISYSSGAVEPASPSLELFCADGVDRKVFSSRAPWGTIAPAWCVEEKGLIWMLRLSTFTPVVVTSRYAVARISATWFAFWYLLLIYVRLFFWTSLWNPNVLESSDSLSFEVKIVSFWENVWVFMKILQLFTK